MCVIPAPPKKQTQVICPKAGECKSCAEFYERTKEIRHDIPHKKTMLCDASLNCPACIPIQEVIKQK